METDKIKLIEKIKSVNFSEPKKILNLIEPFIIIDSNEGLGQSKFGGTPNLPIGFEWPYFKDKPMVFFAQINLDELKDLDIENILPKKGILYFFSYFENPGQFGATYDFIKNKEEYKVLFYEGDTTNLNKMNFPKDLIKKYHFEENIMSFVSAFQVPSTVETWKLEKSLLSDNDFELYKNFIWNEFFPYNSMLGTPTPIQYGVDYSWVDSYLKFNLRLEESVIEKENMRSDFINILSFEMGNQFSAIGMSNCYFGIRKVDLLEKNFSNVIFVMQGT